ncbi:DUF2867 domain-containing protein [uncultured Jatrophihabitans sp.]|uniref:DUF2867 domain-containing protein n=1 Tax=uncultured Jatrophihabitans sp. TaxID=1610747 RepID=UPI0035CBF57F
MTTPRTQRVPVPERIGTTKDSERAGYRTAVRLNGGPSLSPEQWARGTFERAPSIVRYMLLLGWRLAFRLRLGSRTSAGTVLGWYVTESSADLATVSAGSKLLEAQHHFLRDSDGIVWVTLVRAHTRAGRLVWRAIAPMHELSMPLLLRWAARHPGV